MGTYSAGTAVSRDLARLMLMMRRLIKEEFTVTIHLDEPEAVEELFAFAARARSSLLREMALELAQALGQSDPASGKGEPGTRGHRPESSPVGREEESSTPHKTAIRIYRGQKIS